MLWDVFRNVSHRSASNLQSEREKTDNMQQLDVTISDSVKNNTFAIYCDILKYQKCNPADL